MLLRRFLTHVRSENWFAVFLDLLVVIVGLFIGLQVDTWWQDRQESKLADAYVLEIQEDFERNKSRLETSISRLERIMKDLVALYDQATLETPTRSVPDLNEQFKAISSMPAFIPVSRAYDNLVGSGDLRLIKNRELKNALADYYSAAELTMLVQNTHEMELVQIYEPYIIENLDYAAVQTTRVDDHALPPPIEASSILAVMNTRTFRNILTQKWVISTDLLDQHRGMMERTDRVLEMLKSTDVQ